MKASHQRKNDYDLRVMCFMDSVSRWNRISVESEHLLRTLKHQPLTSVKSVLFENTM